LKKTKYPLIEEEDLFLGATVTIYSRQYKIIDYADDFTKKAFSENFHLEKAFALIKPDVYT
jgi:nucleoside-diphosphate kinase